MMFMDYLSDTCFAIIAMGICCWASNIYPGIGIIRGAMARLFWWALPIFTTCLACELPYKHCFIISGAAWFGSWIPHSETPSPKTHLPLLIGDTILNIVRSILLLAPIAVALWLCGLFWFEMLKAAAFSIPCVILGNITPIRIPGAKRGKQITGIYYGMVVGCFLVSAIYIKAFQPDLIP